MLPKVKMLKENSQALPPHSKTPYAPYAPYASFAPYALAPVLEQALMLVLTLTLMLVLALCWYW